MNRKLYIIWPNDQTVTIYLENNPAADYYYNCIKHLQHVPLNFNHRSNSLIDTDLTTVNNELFEYGSRLNLEIELPKTNSQEYLNYLHDIYFQNVKQGKIDPLWLKFHDCIHLIEECTSKQPRVPHIWIEFADKAGLLEQNLDRSWLKYAVTKVAPGDCTMREHELGKSLLLYKTHNEKLNQESINQLAKPWYTLRPTLDIMLRNFDPYQTFVENEQEEFLEWFAPYQKAWCAHWQIPDWQPWEMFAKIPIGKIDDITTLKTNFSNGYYPNYIKQ